MSVRLKPWGGVEFLTAEIKVCKSEACENKIAAGPQQCLPGKVTITVLWEVKGVVPSDITSAVTVRSSEPLCETLEGRKHEVEEFALTQNSFSFYMTMLDGIQERE